ncbi:hypothetical protein LshimejAT787_0502820 [Lyophyllum shimeji]|uniref:Uncharacterized protein n=1 Tax=Lyophyllum shimeji TaxID=47721 RepID=A0A9P3PN89_LYOSH|nr:hypothetical protein LshimejAT787_0502820 [Lyophyllum shimeji]
MRPSGPLSLLRSSPALAITGFRGVTGRPAWKPWIYTTTYPTQDEGYLPRIPTYLPQIYSKRTGSSLAGSKDGLKCPGNRTPRNLTVCGTRQGDGAVSHCISFASVI